MIGSKKGMNRFLTTMVLEFVHNNRKDNVKCRSPFTTDQWTVNYLYYQGRFGKYQSTFTLPWGSGPVLTAGKACMTRDKKRGAMDLIPRLVGDRLYRIVREREWNVSRERQEREEEGEGKVKGEVYPLRWTADFAPLYGDLTSSPPSLPSLPSSPSPPLSPSLLELNKAPLVNFLDQQLPGVVHQYDRCGQWAEALLRSQPEAFGQREGGKEGRREGGKEGGMEREAGNGRVGSGRIG